MGSVIDNVGENKFCFGSAVAKLLRNKATIDSTSSSYTHVNHIRQQETWDCGIACLQMVLQWLRTSLDDDIEVDHTYSPWSRLEVLERKLLLSKINTESIWTVDLAMLLEKLLLQEDDDLMSNGYHENHPNHHNTTYLFISQVLGTNAQLAPLAYYCSAFETDSQRVQEICDDMQRLQLPFLCPFYLEFQQLIYVISQEHCVAIVLVDNSILMRPAHQSGEKTTTDNNTSQNTNDEYMGHYVIVTGISREPEDIVASYTEDDASMLLTDNYDQQHEDEFCLVVVNPGITRPVMFVSPTKFELAWRAEGTDCDVLFVAKH
jgi:Guanylylate cyclase